MLGSVDDDTDLGRGYYLRPTLVLGAADHDALVAEEQFGPALPVLAYDSLDEAVARANAGDLGLAASVWSADEERAFAVASRLDAGFTFVNTHNRTGMSLRAPFGGRQAVRLGSGVRRRGRARAHPAVRRPRPGRVPRRGSRPRRLGLPELTGVPGELVVDNQLGDLTSEELGSCVPSQVAFVLGRVVDQGEAQTGRESVHPSELVVRDAPVADPVELDAQAVPLAFHRAGKDRGWRRPAASLLAGANSRSARCTLTPWRSPAMRGSRVGRSCSRSGPVHDSHLCPNTMQISSMTRARG